MFSNVDAITTLVIADSRATESEKNSIVSILKGEQVSHDKNLSEVVGFKEAANMLGYTSARAVYAAVRRGNLEGFYGGATGRRASGVKRSSLTALLARKKA